MWWHQEKQSFQSWNPLLDPLVNSNRKYSDPTLLLQSTVCSPCSGGEACNQCGAGPRLTIAALASDPLFLLLDRCGPMGLSPGDSVSVLLSQLPVDSVSNKLQGSSRAFFFSFSSLDIASGTDWVCSGTLPPLLTISASTELWQLLAFHRIHPPHLYGLKNAGSFPVTVVPRLFFFCLAFTYFIISANNSLYSSSCTLNT